MVPYKRYVQYIFRTPPILGILILIHCSGAAWYAKFVGYGLLHLMDMRSCIHFLVLFITLIKVSNYTNLKTIFISSQLFTCYLIHKVISNKTPIIIARNEPYVPTSDLAIVEKSPTCPSHLHIFSENAIVPPFPFGNRGDLHLLLLLKTFKLIIWCHLLGKCAHSPPIRDCVSKQSSSRREGLW